MADLEELQKQFASMNQEVVDMKQGVNDFFLIVNGMIIYLMQCGFAFLECGAVRSKNATNILIKNVLDSFIGAVAYWTIGYPVAYGRATPNPDNVNGTDIGGSHPFIGYNFWAADQLPPEERSSWFFQFVFAATCSTIISGAVAERCEFMAYMIYCPIITGFVYPVVTHWGWTPDGWLSAGAEYVINNATVTVGYQDFAGSGMVHITGGVAALCGAAMLGPRIGRFSKRDGDQEIKGHSVPLAALGGFILFFGFFAFNGGSQLTISQKGDGAVVALACINTILAAAGAAVFTLFTTRIKDKTWSLLTVINAGLAGMVSICAGCNVMYPWAAVVTGFVAGAAYMFWSWFIATIKVDDPLDAFAVHGGGGMWGVIATAMFKMDDGVIYSGASQASLLSLGWAFAGIAAIAAWTGGISLVMFGTLRCFGLLRVSEEYETKGMDIPKHGEPAYPRAAYGHGWGEQGDALTDMVSQATKALAITSRGSISDALTDNRPNKFENAEMEADYTRRNNARKNQLQQVSAITYSNKNGGGGHVNDSFVPSEAKPNPQTRL